LARPKADLPAPEAVRALLDPAGRLAVRVTPGASRDAIEVVEDRLLVRVRARALDGKANAAVLELVARGLGLAPSRVALLRGAASREKLLQVVQ
jgi:uncharacterized protein YggU (UPF0235/DUF167 family)